MEIYTSGLAALCAQTIANLGDLHIDIRGGNGREAGDERGLLGMASFAAKAKPMIFDTAKSDGSFAAVARPHKSPDVR
ncbi:hypothetical protein V1318_02850 [Lysobacter sp. CCNWLW3]|uniref:hypothetical protein n=1 Tax=unclassified Lysobacter TaxID=2635362 RepID=UPI002FCF267E